VLAHAGLGSRRSCEDLIKQGRVSVDGQVVRELGTRVDPSRAKIAVDGEPIRLESMVYFAVNKPRGYVSTDLDPAGRPRVVDLLPEVPERVYTVGRLDEDSTGLMILTNDGELANRLAHPRYGVEKLYRALVAGSPDQEIVAKLTAGVWLSDGKVRAKRARLLGRQGQANVLELVLAEGKNREIRRMLARLGHKVMSLNRVAVGPISVKGLATGECRSLSRHEVELLWKVANGVPVSLPRFLDGASSTRRPNDANRPRKPERGQGRRDHDRPARNRHNDSLRDERTSRGSKEARPPGPYQGRQARPPRQRHPDAPSRQNPAPFAPNPKGRKPPDRRRSGPHMANDLLGDVGRPHAGSSPRPASSPPKRRIIGLNLDPPVSPGARSNRDRGRKRPPPRKHRHSSTAPAKRPTVPFRPRGSEGDEA
jgi:23S rRNA pseudouridine2605 synthase